jgi:hypothetical protein
MHLKTNAVHAATFYRLHMEIMYGPHWMTATQGTVPEAVARQVVRNFGGEERDGSWVFADNSRVLISDNGVHVVGTANADACARAPDVAEKTAADGLQVGQKSAA